METRVKKLRILLSNDDGVFAEGINTLARVLADIADITIVAPDRNRSGASNSLTLESPLRVRQIDEHIHSVQGTPTDCVHFALNELMKDNLPDLIIAGINHGANLGDDTLYSGTVAAATEGHFLGLPAIAISLAGREHFDTAAQVALKIVNNHLVSPLTTQKVLNVNVPDCEYEQLTGWEVTRLGARHHAESMIKDTDPRGETIYWLGPPGKKQDAGEGTDFFAVKQHRVSITPLQVDLTAHGSLGMITDWLSLESSK
ncbi:5'/3'-nucleotidase SurE [Aliivibrio fischeri]|uniref:5'/3'-nucleotidase SurE n=1 Tax=Aliivibrio fischeri TaxID=668 RepID=UPI00107E6DFF|nr:5'/3'-nucleotidase SurE [Aliivibrio fischeri]TGA70662.1 5'/3'-nucleotidase SurE [Aliivibrio fischeri]